MHVEGIRCKALAANVLVMKRLRTCSTVLEYVTIDEPLLTVFGCDV